MIQGNLMPVFHVNNFIAFPSNYWLGNGIVTKLYCRSYRLLKTTHLNFLEIFFPYIFKLCSLVIKEICACAPITHANL